MLNLTKDFQLYQVIMSVLSIFYFALLAFITYACRKFQEEESI